MLAHCNSGNDNKITTRNVIAKSNKSTSENMIYNNFNKFMFNLEQKHAFENPTK